MGATADRTLVSTSIYISMDNGVVFDDDRGVGVDIAFLSASVHIAKVGAITFSADDAVTLNSEMDGAADRSQCGHIDSG